MKKTVIIFLSIAIVGFVGYASAFLYLVYQSPLTYKELDLNKNGYVSYSEVEYASNYRTRAIRKNGKECVGYYAQKDGLALKVVCNS